MAGASDAHVTVAGNVYMALRNHLRGSPCSVFISDMKLRVEEDNAFFYPDVFVTCADSDRGQSHSKSAPVLVVEVLSPTTSAYDRGAKFAAYRKLPTLREYALIDPERLSLDLFRREGDSKRPLGAAPHRGWRPRRMGQRGPASAAGGPVRRRGLAARTAGALWC